MVKAQDMPHKHLLISFPKSQFQVPVARRTAVLRDSWKGNAFGNGNAFGTGKAHNHTLTSIFSDADNAAFNPITRLPVQVDDPADAGDLVGARGPPLLCQDAQQAHLQRQCGDQIQVHINTQSVQYI